MKSTRRSLTLVLVGCLLGGSSRSAFAWDPGPPPEIIAFLKLCEDAKKKCEAEAGRKRDVCEADAESRRGDCLAEAERRNNDWRDMCLDTWLAGGFDPVNPEGNDVGRDNCLAVGRSMYKQDKADCEKQYNQDMGQCENQYEQDMANCQKTYEDCKKGVQKTCLLGIGASACSFLGGIWIAGVGGGAGTCSVGGTVVSGDTLDKIAASLFLWLCTNDPLSPK